MKCDHKDVFVYFNLGQVYEKHGKYQEAIRAYKAVYELNQDLAEAARKISYLKIKMLEKNTAKMIKTVKRIVI
jgi:tetratricopeptide (TPR) repeat protein